MGEHELVIMNFVEGVAIKIDDIPCNVDEFGELWISYANLIKLLHVSSAHSYVGGCEGAVFTKFPMMTKRKSNEWKRNAQVWVVNPDGLLRVVSYAISSITKSRLDALYQFLDKVEQQWPGKTNNVAKRIEDVVSRFVQNLPQIKLYSTDNLGSLHATQYNGMAYFSLDDALALFQISKEKAFEVLLPEEQISLTIKVNEGEERIDMIGLTGFMALLNTCTDTSKRGELRKWLASKFLPLISQNNDKEVQRYIVPHYFDPHIATTILFGRTKKAEGMPTIGMADIAEATIKIIAKIATCLWVDPDVVTKEVYAIMRSRFGIKGANYMRIDQIKFEEWYAAAIALMVLSYRAQMGNVKEVVGIEVGSAMLELYSYYKNSWLITPEKAIGTIAEQTYVIA